MRVRAGTVFLTGFLLVHFLSVASPSLAQSNEELKKGVVKITALEGQKKKVGAGFIVKAESDALHIVTAAHVVAGDSQPKVQFFTQQDVQIQATVKHAEGSDDPTALALLVLRGKGNMPVGLAAMSLTTATRVMDGDDIMVIGHPRGAGDWAIIKGNIASIQGRHLTVDANIDEGNSGGPIMHNGQVVGLIGGAQRYGKGIRIGSVREYLEGHGVVLEERTLPSVDKAVPPSSQPPQPTSGPAREITGKDGAPMVLIPAGEFWMGSPDGEGDKNEHPLHQVMLDAFYMDKFELTVARYAEFVRSKNRAEPQFWDQVDGSKHGNLPVMGVDWHDAEAYCRWAGKRVPTEAEWEKAARGTDGRMYPWGNEQPTTRFANFEKRVTFSVYDNLLAAVDGYEAGNSPYGLHHMAGNVWEWTADWYDEHYYEKSPPRNPKGPSSRESRVIRGGSWAFGPVSLRSASRTSAPPSDRSVTVGFRCAQDIPK